ncbi:MAG: RecB family exonuclease [Planctomycetota bacterium]|jgi:RecB family exonuclease
MIRIGRGPRATTSLLLYDLGELLIDGRVPDLRAPIIVLVPSRALKRQLTRLFLERFGGALLGLEIQTPYSLANAILASDSSESEADPGFSSILIRREAANLHELNRLLAKFNDGHGLCSGSVSDLLSAGLDEETADLCRSEIQKIDDEPLKQRGLELIDLSLKTRQQLIAMSLSRTSFVFERASTALSAPDLPHVHFSKILVFGFSDAPGRTTEFLRDLLGRFDGHYYLDLPPEITDSQAESKGAVFAREFAQGLGFTKDEVDSQETKRLLPAQWQGFSAVGTEAEIREVAGRVAALVDDGCDPCKIGIVVRDMHTFLPAIRVQFEAFAIPFRGGALPRGFHPMSSTCGALQGLILGDRAFSLDQLMELIAAGTGVFKSSHSISRIGLRLRGLNLKTVGDLDEWRKIHPHDTHETSRLDFTSEIENEGDGWTAKQLHLSNDVFRQFLTLVDTIREWSERQSEQQSVGQWTSALQILLGETLGWQERQDSAELLKGLSEFRASFDSIDAPVSRTEFQKIFNTNMGAFLEVGAGNSGNGVEVLTLEKARSLTFNALFVVGVTRGTYPRLGNEDPLLTDKIRMPLGKVLNRLGRHKQRPDEESYLFAQLLESADEITLSWQRADDDGKTCARSPFIDRLELEEGRFPVEHVPRDLNEAIERDVELKRAILPVDAALWSGAHGSRESQTAAKSAMLRFDRPDEMTTKSSNKIAQAWTDVIMEIDPNLSDQEERQRLQLISPWFGFLGQDSRRKRTYVTTLEKTAGCPWQAFVSKLLGLEQTPDPWAELPELDALLIGNTVHRALETLVEVEAKNTEPPTADAINEAALIASKGQLGDLHTRLPGLASILATIARPFIQRAFALDWREDHSPEVVGVETTDSVTVKLENGGNQVIYYKADRVDKAENGKSITDYKTGSPLSKAVKVETRLGHTLKAINAGTLLQGAAYAVGTKGTGRYVYLKPETSDDAAIAELSFTEDLEKRFRAVAGRLMDAWHQGLFPPRLEAKDGTPNTACDYCDLKAACLHGDSGSRRRLAELAGNNDANTSVLLKDLWSLASYVDRKLESEA